MENKISELNRLLLAVKEVMDDSGVTLINSVIEQCKAVVIEGIMPEHNETIRFAEKIGFIKQGQKKLHLLISGRYFLELNKESMYDLLPAQKNYILRTCFLHGHFREETLFLLYKFSPDYKDNTFRWSAIDDTPLKVEGWFIERLIELGLLIPMESGFEISSQYINAVSAFLDEGKGWTLESFEQYLAEKKEVGDIAERAVFAYESERLAGLGCEVEAKCIRIISRLRVNAGYDIESFDNAAPGINYNRFIEVKGAKSPFIRFFWTENEMTIAKKLGKNYWIYFQGGIDAKNGVINNDPLLFQDPLNTLMKDADITNTPQGLIIQGKMKGVEVSKPIKK